MNDYTISTDGEQYTVQKNGQTLRTPMGRPVETAFEPLARRLLVDLKKYGENPTNPVSLVAFHYAMLDFFSVLPREQLEYSVVVGLDPENDWTFHCPSAAPEPMMEWMGLFGRYSDVAEPAKEWLSSLTLMQLCAVCVIGRALESVNIPFIVANVLEPNHVKMYAKAVNTYYPYVGVKELTRFFENYLFYYSLETPPKKGKKKARSPKGSAAPSEEDS